MFDADDGSNTEDEDTDNILIGDRASCLLEKSQGSPGREWYESLSQDNLMVWSKDIATRAV